jgi:hypothetical protein
MLMEEEAVMFAFRWVEFEETYGPWQNFWIAAGVVVFLVTCFLIIWWDFRARAARRAERKLEESDWWQQAMSRLGYQIREGEIPCPKCQRALNPTTDRVGNPDQQGEPGSAPVLLRCMWCATVTEYPSKPLEEAEPETTADKPRD